MDKTIYMKRAFRNSFLQLLKTKPVDKISVTEIATTSKYSRQTFYRTFESIDDLIWFIHQDNVSVAHNLMLDLGFSKTTLKLYLDLLLLNKDFYKKIIASEEGQIFVNLYIKSTKKKICKYFFNSYCEMISENEDLKLSLDFYNYGVSHVTIEWIKNDCNISTKHLAKTMIDNMPEVLKEFVGK